MTRYLGQQVKFAGVDKFVHVDDGHGALSNQRSDKRRSDEACAASYEIDWAGHGVGDEMFHAVNLILTTEANCRHRVLADRNIVPSGTRRRQPELSRA